MKIYGLLQNSTIGGNAWEKTINHYRKIWYEMYNIRLCHFIRGNVSLWHHTKERFSLQYRAGSYFIDPFGIKQSHSLIFDEYDDIDELCDPKQEEMSYMIDPSLS